MKKGDYISTILQSGNTVFTFKDIALLWGNPGTGTTRVRINYYVKTGKIIRLRRGIYAKNQNYNYLELATKIITPSYVSLETVLAKEGIVFQYFSQVFVASYLTREVVCDNRTYSFKKFKENLLLNSSGIENKDGYSIATKERAFLDTAYINKDYHFDNMSPLNWDKVFELLPVYENKRLNRTINKLYKSVKEER